MSLEIYRERVDRLAQRNTGDPIFVGSLDQAAIIVEKLFALARSHVLIVTGKLNARVYGVDNVREQARLFLVDPTHRVRIIVEEPDGQYLVDHPLLDAVPTHKGFSNLEIRALPKKNQSMYDFHFMVVDGESYRFERNREEPVAIAAFGDKAGAQNMEGIFERLWSMANCISPEQRAMAVDVAQPVAENVVF